MTRAWIWSINLCILLLLLLALGTIFSLTRGAETTLLNCSSELYEPGDGAQAKQYLLVDLVTKGKRAQMHYRYFNLDGSLAGSISMEGELKASAGAGNRYSIAIHSKEEKTAKNGAPKPMHMNYVSYVSGLNLSGKGLHEIELEILELDKARDYAIVLFQPSNTVCGCRLIH
ncbi:hypothetical protein [Shewanella litorisediminis]|uniref:CHRD domain-containing protein n=1 Tax=Shewanella litorisediminis TaxID=1173586 RepID=A0ABX7G175_9GAMM|nr:hypothetical protein [Shewanella litorisediminis]MCL2918941.1 hypothetical protein [Shewanella litorisediminis]QRH01010.1 hypothetical protein JQC75_14235 [Shewanella litorisediminis]